MAAGIIRARASANSAVIRNPMRSPVVAAMAALAVLALWPAFVHSADVYLRVLGLAFFYAALAMAWNLVALSGVVSLGHAAFFGLGAYGAALADMYWQCSAFWTILVGGLAAAAYGALWAWVFHNLRGAAFALATLASVEIPKVIIDNWDGFTRGSLGIVGISDLPLVHWGSWSVALGSSLQAQYYLLLLFMVGVAALHYLAIHSHWGWAVRAVREDETAAASLGVPVHPLRFAVLVLSALVTGLGGALYAHLMGLIEPMLVFSLHLSALPLIISIFGGRYHAWGPIIGALILYPADQLLFHPWLPSGHLMLYGLVIVVALVFFPRGIASWLSTKRTSA